MVKPATVIRGLKFSAKTRDINSLGSSTPGKVLPSREEHLLPLHVCFGAAMAANLKAINVFNERLLGVKTSAFLWQ